MIISVAAMVLGAGRDDTMMTALAAMAFLGLILAIALRVNVPIWRHAASDATCLNGHAAMRRNTRLAMLVYAWGAAGLFAIYSLTGLAWYHAWQYAAGAALMALALLLYVRRIGINVPPRTPPLSLTILHGAAAAGGLLYLFRTGKLAMHRSDWAANYVFLFGGLTIVALCAIAAVTQSRAPERR